MSNCNFYILVAVIVFIFPSNCFASSGASGEEVSLILAFFVFLLASAKIGGFISEKFNQPAVLGELLAGVVFGFMGANVFDIDIVRMLQMPQENIFSISQLEDNSSKDVGKFFYFIGQIGVVILLLKSGLETKWSEMRKVGGVAFLVATVGVVMPMVLGYIVCELIMNTSWQVNLFVASVLAATSVGITARVFSDLGASNTVVAQIVQGAAVIDDVMGLIVLGIVVGLVTSSAVDSSDIALFGLIIIVKAVGFLVGTVLIGLWLAPRIGAWITLHKIPEGKLAFALIYGLSVSWLAGIVGLAPIVGAFLAGLVLEEEHFEADVNESKTVHLIDTILHFILPVFFILMGLQVRVEIFYDISVILLATALTVAAIVGKQVCSLVVRHPVDRLAVGFGMIPRGEVGLIIAAMGQSIQVDGAPLISPSIFSAIVIMVIVTTLITPPLLQLRHSAILGK